ncbi:YybH family protein [Sphingorhabdus contaminans]|uniref:YybH family protein n=1 Tax=Sphingorhabdus contaminans TaxID=1343899 RepID=UPI003D2970DB
MKAPLFTLALALVLASPSVAKDQKAELAAAGDNWNALYAAGDWAGLRKLYTDDAWLMSDKAPAAKGADAIIAYLRRYRDMGASVTFRFEPEDIRVDGKLGTVVAKYWMTAQMPGRPQVRTSGRSLLIYRRVDGGWKLWRDMDNTTPDVAVEKPN